MDVGWKERLADRDRQPQPIFDIKCVGGKLFSRYQFQSECWLPDLSVNRIDDSNLLNPRAQAVGA